MSKTLKCGITKCNRASAYLVKIETHRNPSWRPRCVKHKERRGYNE